jgi:hypothetical protein
MSVRFRLFISGPQVRPLYGQPIKSMAYVVLAKTLFSIKPVLDLFSEVGRVCFPLFQQRGLSFCRVDWELPMLQVNVCFLGCHLASRWRHTISAVHQLYPSPSQNRTSGFPASGSSLKHSASGSTGSCALSPSHLSVFDLCSQCAHALNRVCVSSFTDVRAREPSLHGDEPFHRYTGSRPSTGRPLEQLLSRSMFVLGRHTQDPSRKPGLLHDCCWLDAV